MYLFLAPLLIGFTLNSASAFTTFYSHHFGDKAGRLLCTILRNVLGIPVWAIGYGMAVMAPPSQLYTSSLISSVLAWLLMISGGVIIIISLWSLRARAAAPSMRDTLVRHGLYAYIRHPLYTGMLLELAGLFLWVATLPMLLACLLGVLWIMLQARFEELDLLQRLPAYREYMQGVPRFLPNFKRL
ncbi:MAG TPA: isoprenylcysteine carboxylmethyltransferase family protein [Anaerolineales bacterium]